MHACSLLLVLSTNGRVWLNGSARIRLGNLEDNFPNTETLLLSNPYSVFMSVFPYKVWRCVFPRGLHGELL